MQLFSGMTNRGQGISQILALPYKPYAQFWFLYDLFFIFLLYMVLSRWMSQKAILVVAGILYLTAPFMDFWQFNRISSYFIFFVLGSIIKEFNFKKVSAMVIIILFIVLNVGYFQLTPTLEKWQLVNQIAVFTLAIVGIMASCWIAKIVKWKWLAYLGSISMPIYIMHLLATAGIRIILLKLGIDSLMINLVLGTVGGLLLSVIAYWICKKLNLLVIFGMQLNQ